MCLVFTPCCKGNADTPTQPWLALTGSSRDRAGEVLNQRFAATASRAFELLAMAVCDLPQAAATREADCARQSDAQGQPVRFEVVLQRQGVHEKESRTILCCPTYEELHPKALEGFAAALAGRGVDETTVVLRWRDPDGQQFTIHGQGELKQAIKDAADEDGVVHLDFLLQLQPASRMQRSCRRCSALFTSRNQLFQHLKESGHDSGEDAPEDTVAMEPSDSREAAHAELGNKSLLSYYSRQQIASQEAWACAYEVLKKPLPLVVRISNSCLGLAVERRLLQMTELQAMPLLMHCWMLPQRLDAEVSALVAAAQEIGALHRQEWASTLPVLALDVQADDSVLDLCASPGSKTLQMLDILTSKPGRSEDTASLLVANDYSRPRAVVVAQRCRRQGKQSLLVTNCDGRKFPSLRRLSGYKIKFRKVLVDAPCSGDGTLRKNPGNWIAWRAGEALTLHTLQLGLLRRGFECLEAGGRLVYSTCSLNPIEDEAVVGALLSEFPSAAVEPWPGAEGSEFQEGLTTWQVPAMDFEQTGEMYSFFSELGSGMEHKKWATESMFPPAPARADQLRYCRRALPAGEDAHHGGFFVAVLSKQGGDATLASKNENLGEVPRAGRRASPQPPRGLFQRLPDEVRSSIENYWGLCPSGAAAAASGVRRFPLEQLHLNNLGQVILATKMLSQCSVGKNVQLPVVEAACTVFPSASSLLPFDEAVPVLAECATRHVEHFTCTKFQELLENRFVGDNSEEALPWIATCQLSGVTFAVAMGGRHCYTSQRYAEKLLVVVRALERESVLHPEIHSRI